MVGTKIKELRERQNLSQEELAKRMSCTRSMIYAYESGIRQPKIETIQRFAEALEVDVSELIDMSELLSGRKEFCGDKSENR